MTGDLKAAVSRQFNRLGGWKPSGLTEAAGRSVSFSRPLKAGEVDVTHGRILYLEDVSVSFDGFKAINGLNLDIAPGELRCIIGPNGAGKTTMMDIITGKTRPDSGTVFFGSTIDLLRYSEPEIAALGIGRKFQKPTVFEELSVFENQELALATHKGVWPSMRFGLNGEQKDRLAEVLGTIHLKDAITRRAGDRGQRRPAEGVEPIRHVRQRRLGEALQARPRGQIRLLAHVEHRRHPRQSPHPRRHRLAAAQRLALAGKGGEQRAFHAQDVQRLRAGFHGVQHGQQLGAAQRRQRRVPQEFNAGQLQRG